MLSREPSKESYEIAREFQTKINCSMFADDLNVLAEIIDEACSKTRQRIAHFLHSCSDSWGRAADQYESYGDAEQSKACAQTSTAMAAAARTIEKGNE